jgi:hypothetical protein
MKMKIYAYAGRFAFVILLVFTIAVPGAMAQANIQGQWSTLPNPMPINPIHVALLPNGKILVVAGSGNCPPSQSGCPPQGGPWGPTTGSGALLWDPGTENYTQWFTINSTTVGGFTGFDMFCNGMVLLPDGRALIDGGTIQYDPFHGQPQVAVFDPATNTFGNVQNMAHGRWYPTVLTLGDGREMTFSGLNETGGTNTAVEFYTVGSGWSTQNIANWTPDLYPRLHLLPNGKVFYSGAQTTSKLFDPSTTTWNTNVATTNYSGTRTYGTSVLLPLTPANNYDPKVIIMGGGNPATNTTEVIDMGASTPGWRFGPNMSQARIEMNAVILPDGKVLALGGSVNDEDTTITQLSLNADLYDPASNTFSSGSANTSQRLYHSVALLLPDATVWVAGGNPSRGTYNTTIEIYKPPYLFSSTPQPTITSAPSSISYGNTFSVTTPDAANISSVVLVRNGTVTHAFGTDQREVGLSFTIGSGALTVTAPPNGNIAPPGYYMLFILNNGVPSVASFVQLTAAAALPDFSISATPSSQTVAPAGGTTYTASVTPSNGFTGSVTFSVTGLPSGATASFSPSSVSGSGSSTLSVSTSSSTPSGSYTLTIQATNGSNLTHSTQVTLVVADFSLSASPSSRTVSGNSKTTYTVTVTALGPFSAPVNFSVSGLPARTSASFSPTSVVGSGNTTLTVSVKPRAAAGTYPVTITATGGGLTHSTTVNLVIQ